MVKGNSIEIGSEYWLDDKCSNNVIFALSGRTAIDLILQDIKAKGLHPKSVYMPAWCCDSMLQPFVDRGLDISFYDISYANGELVYHIESRIKTDILYVTNYFGYSNSLSDYILNDFSRKGSLILYDRTHSLFLEDDELKSLADYTFASIRKWMGVLCGALLSKKDGVFVLPKLKECPYLEEKIQAMKMKAVYIQSPRDGIKTRFLELYASFNQHLSQNYKNYEMDLLSQNIWMNADKINIKKKRRLNAEFLHQHLVDLSQVQLMYSLEKTDCPLFVPILFKSKEERDRVRRLLIANAIYCPIHWPKPNLIGDELRVNDLYNRELSLICDQRYGLEDMSHIVNVLGEYSF